MLAGPALLPAVLVIEIRGHGGRRQRAHPLQALLEIGIHAARCERPLADRSRALGFGGDLLEAGDLVVHDSADLVIGKLCDGGADLLLESVYPIVVAVLGCHALPVAVAAKGNSYRYASTIVVRSDSDVRRLEDLGGRDILFEDDRSTSGYLVPRSMLEKAER